MMLARPIHLLDQSRARIAVLDVTHAGGHYEGTIDLETTPPQIMKLFEEFEEIVEGQMFSLLDAVEEKIESIALKASFEDGTEAYVDDLQVYPSTRAVSFKTRQPTAV
jgi:hypothetical protein